MPVMRVGLIGDPVEHSRSPRMHNAAFAALGMPASYELWHTTAADVETRVAALRSSGIVGANVTVPHKQTVMPFLDEVSEPARLIGAVNTIIHRDGRLIGDNTDAYGFRASILERYPDIAPNRAIVLGAGGASRAVIVALHEMGATDVLIANRTLTRARDLATELGGEALAWDDLSVALPDTDIVVNATALGWHDETVLADDAIANLPAHAVLLDLTYRHTPFLQSATKHNLRGLDGLGMLIHQGVRSFELWFGLTPPLDVMTAAALSG